jgi:hypothetical protein
VIAAAVALGDTEPDLLAELHTELAFANRIGTAPGYPTVARVGELADGAADRRDATTSMVLRLAAMAAFRDPAAGPATGSLAMRAAASLSHTEPPGRRGAVFGCLVLAVTERLDGVLTAITTVRELEPVPRIMERDRVARS